MKTIFLAESGHRLIGGIQVVEQTVLFRLPAENDVLGHGEAGYQHKVLVDHAHTQRNGVPGAEFLDSLALDGQAAFGGSQNAVEDVHQRGFACTVFTHQREDLALADGKGNIVVGPDPGEFHGDVFKFYDGFHCFNSNRLKVPAQIRTSPGSDPAPYPRRPLPGNGG